jgi:hypothetical protein
MGELTFAAAVLTWGLLPGLLLLWAAGVRWSIVERTAAGACLSLAIVACTAYAAEILRLPVRPLPVAALVGILAAILFGLRRAFPHGTDPALSPWPDDLRRGLRWIPWLVWLTPLAVIVQLEPVASGAVLPPPMHDGLDHANWFRLIYEIGSLNPHEVLAPPLSPSGDPTYYPWGLHAWLALVAQTTTLDPVDVLMRALVLVSAAMPLSVYVFTAYFTGRGWIALAAATLTLVFWWMPYQPWAWGGYPLLAGSVAALPVARLALESIEGRRLAGIAAAGAGLAGLLFIHPSQLFVAALICALVSVTLAAGRVLPWRVAVPFVAVFALTGAALTAGGMFWQPLADFLDRAAVIGAKVSADPRYRTPIGPYFDTQAALPATVRTTLAVLTALGAAVAVVHHRLRAILVLHLVFALLVLIARHHTWATALWYHLPERIWYEQAAVVPLLAAAGMAWGVQLVMRLARRWIDLTRWELAVWALVFWTIFLPMRERFVPWANWRLYHAVHRNPQLALTDRRVLPDFAWMRANIPRGEILFNAPADWGLPLPFTGLRTVYWSGGYAFEPSTPWNDILALLRRGDPYTSQAGAELSARGIHYVYAGRLPAALERRGRDPLEGPALRGAALFHVLYESPTALVLRIDDVRPTLMPLRNTERIRFEGFHPMEQWRANKWRWTNGRGRLLITPVEGTGAECFVRLLGPAPGSFELRHQNQALELTPFGHRLVRDPKDPGPISLDIVSTTFTPPPDAGDERVLGVRVTNIGFSCR